MSDSKENIEIDLKKFNLETYLNSIKDFVVIQILDLNTIRVVNKTEYVKLQFQTGTTEYSRKFLVVTEATTMLPEVVHIYAKELDTIKGICFVLNIYLKSLNK